MASSPSGVRWGLGMSALSGEDGMRDTECCTGGRTPERGRRYTVKKEEGVTGQAQSRKLGPRKRNPIQMASDTAIKALMAKGFSVRKAAEFMGISPTTAQKAMTRLREQGELISGLMSVERDEKTAKLIDHFLDKGLRMKEIKGSDALGAAKLYADRRYPVRDSIPEVPRISFVQVNIDSVRLNQYKSNAPSPLDVTPATEPDPTTSGNGSPPPGS